MGKAAYAENMRHRIQDFGFAIDSLRQKLEDSVDGRTKVELVGQLSQLEFRRHQMEAKLQDLEAEPTGSWSSLKAEFEQEWNDLIQDFEERLGGY